MFLRIAVSEPATFAAFIRPAPPLPSPTQSADHPHRKDSVAAQEPRRVAPDPRRLAMGLDAQWVGRRCLLAIYRSCAAGYDGRASAFALLQRDKAARPCRLEFVPIIIGKWHQSRRAGLHSGTS